jgi:hypothetical protein
MSRANVARQITAMNSLYLWPEHPAASLLVLWALSVLFLWAARDPMLQLLRGTAQGLEGALAATSRWLRSAAERLDKRSREAVLAAGELEFSARVQRELGRIDSSLSGKVGQYADLHRRLDELVHRIDADYESCGDSPPEVPGWVQAVEAVSAIPAASDPNVQKVMQGIAESLEEAEKRALDGYREESARRHRILGKMRGDWKAVRGLLAQMADLVAHSVQVTRKVDHYFDELQALLQQRQKGAHAASYSLAKPFLTSLLVLAVALGGAFVNFQLIALPMSELVPAGARIAGFPVSTISALVLVLMEIAVGIFVMDMLEITDLFPRLSILSRSRRRLILGVGLAGLFFLAAVESSLAILRERIAEADVALRLALAGPSDAVVAAPVHSQIPVVGQAVLGFVLPWILAMVAIPLETFLDSGRHVASRVEVLLLHAAGNATGALAEGMRYLGNVVTALYDVYVSIPLRIESSLRGEGARRDPTAPLASERRAPDTGALR